MSLLYPTPGEVYDRIGIITLKREAAKGSGKALDRFESERLELETYLNFMKAPAESVIGHVDALFHVNSKLWAAENAIRSTEEVAEVALQAKKICALNDERNRLIREIDAAFGVAPSEEKIYSKTA